MVVPKRAAWNATAIHAHMAAIYGSANSDRNGERLQVDRRANRLHGDVQQIVNFIKRTAMCTANLNAISI